MKFAFKDCIWTSPYIVVKVLSNNNYVVRRTGARYTQTLHRIRLRLYAPNQRVPDVTVRREDYLPDPDVKTTHNDWYAQAWETEFGEVLFGNTAESATQEATVTEITDTTENDEITAKMTWLKQPQAKMQRKMTWLKQPQMEMLRRIKHPPITLRHSI